MPKQSPAWNKYSNYYFLSARIAAGINALAMTFVLSHEIAALALLARNDIIQNSASNSCIKTSTR
jgi:hypothetical protein